jgi:hypothetical protein
MITSRAVGYLMLTALTVLAAAFVSVNLLVSLLACLILLPVLSALQLLLARRSVVIDQSIAPRITERQVPSELAVAIQAGKHYAHGRINLVLQTGVDNNKAALIRKSVALPAGRSGRVTITLPALHRGFYQVGLRRALSRDLLGLFYLPLRTRRQCLADLAELVVLPRPVQSEGFAQLAALLAGQTSLQIVRPGDEVNDLANLRHHRPGESMRKVHWKISARLDQIMVKEFENPAHRQGLLLLDMARPRGDAATPAGLLTFSDFYTDYVADLAKQLLDFQIPMRTVFYQKDGREEILLDQSAAFEQLQLALARLDWTDFWAPQAVLQEEVRPEGPNQLVLLASSRLDLATAHALADLRDSGRLVYLVLLEEKADLSLQMDERLDLLAIRGIPVLRLARLDQAASEEASPAGREEGA